MSMLLWLVRIFSLKKSKTNFYYKYALVEKIVFITTYALTKSEFCVKSLIYSNWDNNK